VEGDSVLLITADAISSAFIYPLYPNSYTILLQTIMASTRVPFYFTYLTYERGDWLGCVMCLTSLLPHAVTCALAGMLLVMPTRPGRQLLGYLLAGQFANEFCNVLLKHCFREPRPFQERIDYAMPSSHAQYAGYISTAVYLLIVRPWYRLTDGHCKNRWTRLSQREFARLCCLGVLVMVPWSRFYLDYHDARQIWFGLLFGIGFAIGWARLYWLTSPHEHQSKL
jgi:membrane-associated phospholipid phosphatase